MRGLVYERHIIGVNTVHYAQCAEPCTTAHVSNLRHTSTVLVKNPDKCPISQ